MQTASPKPIPTMPDGSAISPSAITRLATCSWRKETCPRRLRSFQASLAIRDRLAKADPNNAGWQRDLSVSYDKVGDVLVAQGNLPEALKASKPVSPFETASPKPIQTMPDGSAISPSAMRRLATCSWRKAICPKRFKSFQAQPRDCRPPRQSRSKQCRMAARSLREL